MVDAEQPVLWAERTWPHGYAARAEASRAAKVVMPTSPADEDRRR